MSVEPRRACGYRKVGGLYLVSDGIGAPCCKLPIILHVCPTCHGGIKQTRGWTWIDPKPFLSGNCTGSGTCPAASPENLGDRVGLLWIGAQFYPTTDVFSLEALTMGVSRRISAIPNDFKLGKTWVLLAHPKVKQVVNPETGETEWQAGVFRIFRPTRLEKIVTRSQAEDEDAMDRLRDQNITPVIVPDDDKDHQGTVYDKDGKEAVLL